MNNSNIEIYTTENGKTEIQVQFDNETVSVRQQGVGDKGIMKLDEFADFINKEVKSQVENYKIN